MSQYDDYMSDLSLVQMNEKPVVIIERRKSAKAYLLALQVARAGFFYNELMLTDSSGKPDHALVIGYNAQPVALVCKLIANRPQYTRSDFQIALGTLLGYTHDDCVEFVRSSLSLTCGCQLCGGPTQESKADDERTARRLARFVQ